MSIPIKPWETSSINVNNVPENTNTRPYVSNTDRLHSSPIPYPGSGGGVMNASGLNTVLPGPPLPPRPGNGQVRPIYSAYNRSSIMPYSSLSSPYSSYSGGYSPYSTMGMGYGYPGMGGGGMYGNRMYGGGFGNNPYDNTGEPSFTQLAEESSASAFQSIESFVSAFGSISAMLESTFHALYSSFRAVVGVADHLGRVKQILSALAIFRFFKWTFRRIMYLIGISKIKPADVESLWNNISSNNGSGTADSPEWAESVLNPNSKPSSWPIIMFLGFIFAGPYLMWKLIASLNLNPAQKVDNRKWASGEIEHFVAAGQFDFEGMADRELPFKKGQTIRLAPAKFQPPNIKGWVLASDGVKIGLVPTNYIKILGKRSANPVGNNLFPLPLSQPRSHIQPSTPITEVAATTQNPLPEILITESTENNILS